MKMAISPLAGKPAVKSKLVTRDQICRAYFNWRGIRLNPVKNGTSGHRGVTGQGVSELLVRAMTQALADIIKLKGSFGPKLSPEIEPLLGIKPGTVDTIIMGKDVRYTSDLAQITAAEVFAANGIKVTINKDGRSTPTPVISHRILAGNGRGEKSEGVILTASHNPPEEAGYKTNGRDGGPNTNTGSIDELANYYLTYSEWIKKMRHEEALKRKLKIEEDFITPYVEDLKNAVNFEAIKKGGPFAVSPLGGSASGIYEKINEIYGTNIKVILPEPDPAGSNRTYDWDGKLRGDPSSKYVMMAVDKFWQDLQAKGYKAIYANDNDADRFGGIDATGILNPNHVLCVLFDYLCENRKFPSSMGIGRTIGTTHMLDLIADHYGRPSYEVDVGFKWYVEGLLSGKYALAGEESAGLSFPRFNGSVWVTEKDGIAANLLMMEVIAKTGKDIGTLYGELAQKYGAHQYKRIDSPATAEKKANLKALIADPKKVESMLSDKMIAGKKIERIKVGDGIKVVLEGGIWVLFRASGTEDIIKVYMEERGVSLETANKAAEELAGLLNL